MRGQGFSSATGEAPPTGTFLYDSLYGDNNILDSHASHSVKSKNLIERMFSAGRTMRQVNVRPLRPL